MSLAILFTIAIAALLLRSFWLHVKSATADSESYKALAPKDQLAVLKECLLNNATQLNLKNLVDFCEKNGFPIDGAKYQPLLDKQIIYGRKNASIQDCDALYAEQCIWIDKILPMEFQEAGAAKQDGNQDLYIERSLEGISRLYSDEAILQALTDLQAEYEKAGSIKSGYEKLMEARDTSLADDTSLEALRKLRDAWMEDLLSK